MVQSKDYSISLARFIALMLVVFCHTFEWIGFSLNVSEKLGVLGNYCAVGVQIFLIISGYLYGSRKNLLNERKDSVVFIDKNFKKILLDYYVYVLIVIVPVYTFMQPGVINFRSIFQLITCSDVIGGGASSLVHSIHISSLFSYSAII